jgi:xylitol oxidase
MAETNHNWADNYTYTAAAVHYPKTVEQVQELVRRSHKVKALGSRHSFNAVADTLGDQISLEQFDPDIQIDRKRHTVTVSGGVRYGQLCQQLHQAGYALPNLASLPHISVAGACSTATHGSGDRNGSLATAVSALEIVIANGEVITLSRVQDKDRFAGAVVSMGGLGVITKVTLDLLPTFEVQQDVYENLPLAALDDHFDAITASAYSVSLFTDWRTESINQVWLKRRVGDQPSEAAPELFGARRQLANLHPIGGISAVNCTEQMGIPGPWYDRLPHFRMEFTPSAGEELQTEYLVPRHDALAAIHAIHALRDSIAPLLQISEVRMIAADDLWLSPFYKQPCIGLHFTWKKDWPAVKQVLPLIEAALAPFHARPHWGKLFTMSAPRLQGLYQRLADFNNLLRSYDPDGKFRNGFLDTYVVGTK